MTATGAFPSLDLAALKPATLDDLLAWEGVQFINGAYRTLLQREPDPEGLRFYDDRLKAGISKFSVLEEIADSSEGAANAVKVEGLLEIVILNKLSRVPIIGSLLVGNFFGELRGDANRHPGGRILNDSGLLEYNDRKFVEMAYLMFLKRQPDSVSQ